MTKVRDQLDEIAVTPWGGADKWSSSWHGDFKKIGNVKVGPFMPGDVQKVLYSANSGDDWDGISVAVLSLRDGRLVAWETTWGPTGNGFFEDAYGGDAEIWFAHTRHLKKLILTALSDAGRELVGIPREGLK